MYKILVADDEENIRLLIRKYAEKLEGHEVSEAENGMEAVDKCRENHFDIVVMDIMMPELDGFSATREIRKFSDVPVIFLSARGEEYDRISGFEFGGDDYVVKPFSPKELMLRIDALMKRRNASAAPSETGAPEAEKEPEHKKFTFEGFVVDFDARIVYVDGQRTDLSPKEYDLLFYMITNKNRALKREKLISDVWGYDFYGDDRTLDTHIKLLRKSIGQYSRLIVTVRGVGYRFETT